MNFASFTSRVTAEETLDIATPLKAALIIHGLTYPMLALRTGINKRTIAGYANRNSNVPRSKARIIAEAFGMELGEFLGLRMEEPEGEAVIEKYARLGEMQSGIERINGKIVMW